MWYRIKTHPYLPKCHMRAHSGEFLHGVWQVSERSPVCLVGFTKVSEMIQQNNRILNIGQMSEIFKVSFGALKGVWKMS